MTDGVGQGGQEGPAPSDNDDMRQREVNMFILSHPPLISQPRPHPHPVYTILATPQASPGHAQTSPGHTHAALTAVRRLLGVLYRLIPTATGLSYL